MTATQLPTFQGGDLAFAGFRDSLTAALRADRTGTELRLLFYAVTELGWAEVRDPVRAWLRRGAGRQAVAYIGTDHAITEPRALVRMGEDGVDVRIMVRYRGIYHPKVVWLAGPNRHLLWVGSNNLTREGLRHNIEFATLVRSATLHPDFVRWMGAVEQAASPLDRDLLDRYEDERDSYGAERAGIGTFTWSQREEPPGPSAAVSRRRAPARGPSRPSRPRIAQPGDLLIEVMPRETGQEGNQVQLPKAAGVPFFGLPNQQVGTSRNIDLTYQGGIDPRNLTMTIFANNTIRLVLKELDYRDRPCILVFHRTGRNTFEYEIVQQSLFPSRYRRLLQACVHQTRAGSRRWGIA